MCYYLALCQKRKEFLYYPSQIPAMLFWDDRVSFSPFEKYVRYRKNRLDLHQQIGRMYLYNRRHRKTVPANRKVAGRM